MAINYGGLKTCLLGLKKSEFFNTKMKYIQLTQNQQALVDDEDFERLSKYKWHFNKKNYARTNIYDKDLKKETSIGMHQMIMNTPKGMVTDHINGNGLDNRKENLRICTQANNLANKSKQSNGFTSIYKGVRMRTDRPGNWRKWTAAVKKGITRIHAGSFYTEIEAAKAYDEVAKKIHGEFAKLNFPN